MATKKGPAVPDEVTTFVRQLIVDRRAKGQTWDSIAAEFQVTRTTIIDLEKGSRGVGPEVEQKVANALYDGSIDRFRSVARGEDIGSGRVVERDSGVDRICMRDHPEWAAAEAIARQAVRLPPIAWEQAGAMMRFTDGPVPTITPEVIIDWARGWYAALSDEGKQEAHANEAERLAKRDAGFRAALREEGLDPRQNPEEWNFRMQILRLRADGRNDDADAIEALRTQTPGPVKAKLGKLLESLHNGFAPTFCRAERRHGKIRDGDQCVRRVPIVAMLAQGRG